MRLSVLDQSTASKGRAQDVAIRETLELARHCDALGYHRYWVSEHHNSGSIVGTAPEILMAAIAANFAMFELEEEQHSPARHSVQAHSHA